MCCRVQELVREVPVADHVIRYALRLVRTTRIEEPLGQSDPRPSSSATTSGLGRRPARQPVPGPGRQGPGDPRRPYHVTPEHISAVARPVLRHRILTNFNAEADQVTTDDIIDRLLEAVGADGADPEPASRWDR